jgi:disease resistance protein RPM1
MGGIGKTTPTKKVYENESVKGHFDCRVWISVSQSYNVSTILMSMTKQIFCCKKKKMTKQIYQGKETTLEANRHDR